jgi:thioredoxin reductase (NADPH)
LGPADDAIKKALFMRTFTHDVTVLMPPGTVMELNFHSRERLNRAGIKVEACVPGSLRPAATGVSVQAVTGEARVFDTLYPAMGCTIRSKLAINLGAKCDEVGNLVVDSRQRTPIAGLYAAGDVVNEINQIAVAFGHAAVAGTDIHNYLTDTEGMPNG